MCNLREQWILFRFGLKLPSYIAFLKTPFTLFGEVIVDPNRMEFYRSSWERDFFLAARGNLTAVEKLSLRCYGQRLIFRSMNDYDYQVQDSRNGNVRDVHGTRLKFHYEPFLDTEGIISCVVISETEMPVQRLIHLVGNAKVLFLQVRWHGPLPTEHNLEPSNEISEDVFQVFEMLFLCKKLTLASPVSLASHALGLWRIGV